MVICTKCRIEKDLSQFPDNWASVCKPCAALYKKTYYEENKSLIKIREQKYREDREDNTEQIKEASALYYKENKEKIKEQNRNSYQNNREARLEQGKEYYEENKENITAYKKIHYEENKEKYVDNNKNYRDNNKEQIRDQKKEYKKERRKNDPIYRLRESVSYTIRYALKKSGSIKKGSVLDAIPYTIQEMKKYIEKQFLEPDNEWMNWQNQGIYNKNTWNDNDPLTWTWNLDHITPQSDLPYISMEDENFKKCWALSNLRPYSAKLNIIDGVRRTRHQKKTIKE